MDQKKFDFNRSSQLRILEQADVETRGPGKAVLKALDSYARDCPNSFPSVAELARNVGCSAKTARRTIHELEATGLVSIQPRRRPNGSHATNSYAIDWLKLLELAPASPLFSEASGTPTVGVGTPTVGVGYSHRGSPSKRPSKRPVKRHDGPNEVLKNETDGRRPNWMRELDAKSLRCGEVVLELFAIAVDQGFVGDLELDRIGFFALARFCAIKGKNPGGYFTFCVGRGRDFWARLPRIEDEDAARTIIRKLLYGKDRACLETGALEAGD